MTLHELHQLFLRHPQVCTDTRKITSNCIFFALKGPNFNGNAFAGEALKKGAAYAVVDDAKFKTDNAIVVVTDVLNTLQQLGTYHRNHNKARVVALTGSNGKTTTKELIHAVLSKKYQTIATKGNLNNHIGVPLTLLSIKEETEFAVVEMGANHQGEIEFLSNLAQPDFGYITNFGKAHLEGFGGLEGVIKGKSELYKHLVTHGKSIFLNADDPIQKQKLSSHIKKIGFSQSNDEYYRIELVRAKPFVILKIENELIETQLIGTYNFTNCCIALLVGNYFNVPLQHMKEALESYVPENNRSQLLEKNGQHIVLDAYNANPTSMKAALQNFKAMEKNYSTVFLGDMFELGADAAKEHQELVDFAGSLGFDQILLIGEYFYKTNTEHLKFATFEAVQDYLEKNLLPKGSILIKGSRGMALERILNSI